MSTDPCWVFENFDEAATYIDTLEQRLSEAEKVIAMAKGCIEFLNDGMKPGTMGFNDAMEALAAIEAYEKGKK